MNGRNALILTVREINPAEEVAGGRCGVRTGALLVLSRPWHHPLPLSLSRGDQCFTNNLTYLEITAGNTTLVKHGKQRRGGYHPAHGFTWIETRKGPMSLFYII